MGGNSLCGLTYACERVMGRGKVRARGVRIQKKREREPKKEEGEREMLQGFRGFVVKREKGGGRKNS